MKKWARNAAPAAPTAIYIYIYIYIYIKAGPLQCGFWPQNSQILMWKLPWTFGVDFSSWFFQGKRPEKSAKIPPTKFIWDFVQKNSPRISAEAFCIYIYIYISLGQRWPIANWEHCWQRKEGETLANWKRGVANSIRAIRIKQWSETPKWRQK